MSQPATPSALPEAPPDSAPDPAFAAVPDGTLHWTPAWLSHVPVVRGEYVPPFEAVLAPPPLAHAHAPRLQPLYEAFNTAWAAGGADAVRALPELQEEAWPQWLLIMMQSTAPHLPGYAAEAGWLFDTAIALLGARAVARQLFAVHRAAAAVVLPALAKGQKKLPGGPQSAGYSRVDPHPGLRRLRHAIATLDAAAYLAVRDDARATLCGHTPLDILPVYLLPELYPEWRASPGYQLYGYHSELARELDCTLDAATNPDTWFDLDELALAWLAWRHGVEVLRACEVNLQRDMSTSRKHRLIARFLPLIEHADAIAFAVRHAGHEAIAGVLAQQLARWPRHTAEHILCPPAGVEAGTARAVLQNRLYADPQWAGALQQALADHPAASTALVTLLPPDDAAAADPAQLPEVLRAPPWHSKRRVRPPRLDLDPGTPAAHIDPEFLATPLPPPHPHMQGLLRKYTYRWRAELKTPENSALWLLGVRAERCAAINAGEALQATDLEAVMDSDYIGHPHADIFATLPAALRHRLALHSPLAFWQALKPDADWLRRLLQEYGADILPLFLRLGETRPNVVLDACMAVDWLPLAALAAQGLGQRRARKAAQAWLQAHSASAAHGLLALAFAGSPHSTRASTALHALVAAGHADTVAAAAAAYGAEAAAAWQTLLDTPAWHFMPPRMPALPLWLTPHTLPAPRLRADGSLLPQACLSDLALMFALSRPDEAWAGFAEVAALCTPASLARFGEALLVAWDAQGGGKKEEWMLYNQPLVADAQTVRTLARLLRGWSGARVQNAIRLLAEFALGSGAEREHDAADPAGSEVADTALLYLAALARTAPQHKLRTLASEMLDRVAAELALTRAELADRSVPDLGLDARGSLRLDYGPRQYFVRFDETLAPYVVDAEGQRQKSIPRPNKNDDPDLASAATARYKALKKDVQTVAGQEVARFEQAMRTQRRWSGAVFERLFVHHPLVRHLAQRVVWGVFDGERLTASFRLAEDLSLLDADDEAFQLAPAACIGIAHPLELGPALLSAWQTLFGDYGILQPCEQLARASFAPDAAELAAGEITRFAGRPVAATSLAGLRHRGWRAESDSFIREFTAAHGLVLCIEPGIDATFSRDEAPQRIVRIVHRADDGTRQPLDAVPAIALSEAIRDATLMRAVS